MLFALDALECISVTVSATYIRNVPIKFLYIASRAINIFHSRAIPAPITFTSFMIDQYNGLLVLRHSQTFLQLFVEKSVRLMFKY